ncbi:hypothetical protein MHA_1718 [Mannheimia haemolytica PHL213]|nr:hypothetical protein MHA_1718 [Mannheimia haemolytica PHL213]
MIQSARFLACWFFAFLKLLISYRFSPLIDNLSTVFSRASGCFLRKFVKFNKKMTACVLRSLYVS